MKPFEKSAQVYDLIHKSKDYESEALDVARHLEPAKQLTCHIPRLIDWGCGTGEFTARFSRYGWDTVGIDSSQQMVDVARSKGVHALCMSVFNPPLPLQEVEAATCMYGAFCYMALNYNKTRQALQAIRGHLVRGGRFVFDWINLTACASALIESKEESLEGVKRKMRKGFCPKTNHVSHDIEYEWNGETWKEFHVMRAFSMPEIEAALEHAGFQVIHQYPNQMFTDCTAFPLDSYYCTTVAKAV